MRKTRKPILLIVLNKLHIFNRLLGILIRNATTVAGFSSFISDFIIGETRAVYDLKDNGVFCVSVSDARFGRLWNYTIFRLHVAFYRNTLNTIWRDIGVFKYKVRVNCLSDIVIIVGYVIF